MKTVLKNLAILGVAVVALILGYRSTLPARPEQTESEARAAALELLQDKLMAPATAKVQSVKLLERSFRWYFFYVVVDAQNNYGVYLRHYYCIVLDTVPGSRTYRYNKNHAVQECGIDPEKGTVDHIKSQNRWTSEQAQDYADNLSRSLRKGAPKYDVHALGNDLIYDLPDCDNSCLDRFSDSIRPLWQEHHKAGFVGALLKGPGSESRYVPFRQ